MTTPATKRIEVFRPGTFTPMKGDALTFSADDLRALARAYDASAAPAPAVIGHPTTDAPAYAWAKSFSFDETNERLVAELGEIEPQFAEAVEAGRYRKISLELFAPASPSNPKPGTWYPKHIGFLGAAAPAVPGLKPVAFAADDTAVTFEFADAAALRDVATMFRSLRDFMIEKFGLESAEKALPTWTIQWIDEAAEREPLPAIRSFAEPKDKTMSDKPNNPPVDPALAERAKEIERRERELNHRDHVAFAENLVTENRLLPALKDKVVALFDGLAATTAADGSRVSVAFAEGGSEKSVPALDLLRDILKAQPAVVSFGQIEAGNEPSVASFAMAEGMKADPVSMAIHQKALAYQAKHPGTGYAAAAMAVATDR